MLQSHCQEVMSLELMNLMVYLYPYLAKIECNIKILRLNVSMLDDNNDVCVSGGFYYVINMVNLRSTALLVEVPFNYTIRKFTTLKKLTFPRGGKFISTWWIDLDSGRKPLKQIFGQSHLQEVVKTMCNFVDTNKYRMDENEDTTTRIG